MVTEVRMPMWGMGMLEGTIVTWYKKEGETVEVGEPLAEVEAAKTTQDLVAPAAGVISRIIAAEGETVPIHEVVAILGTATDVVSGEQVAAPPSEPEEPHTPSDSPVHSQESAGPAKIVPRARMLARRFDIDLNTISGTGPGGRITVADVENARGERAGETTDSAAWESFPLTGTRRVIATRMRDSLREMAQFTLMTTADVTDLVSHRAQWTGNDPRPSYTDYIVRAVALTLLNHRRVNAHPVEDEIRVLESVDIGIATAVPNGLLVPVLHEASELSLAQIAAGSAELVSRVRSGSITPEEITGSSFTITSLGSRGVDWFTPIINPPEVAILGVGQISEQPARAEGGIEWRRRVSLSLTVDHRGVDGAPAAEFLQEVAARLGEPESL